MWSTLGRAAKRETDSHKEQWTEALFVCLDRLTSVPAEAMLPPQQQLLPHNLFPLSPLWAPTAPSLTHGLLFFPRVVTDDRAALLKAVAAHEVHVPHPARKSPRRAERASLFDGIP